MTVSPRPFWLRPLCSAQAQPLLFEANSHLVILSALFIEQRNVDAPLRIVDKSIHIRA